MFDTEVECQNKCDVNYNNDTPTKLVDVCSLEIDPGPCRGTLWYYGFMLGLGIIYLVVVL